MAYTATSSTEMGREESAGVNGAERKPRKESSLPNEYAKTKARPNDAETASKDPGKKANVVVRIWKKLEMDLPTLMMMFKATIPPAISLAMYEADVIAQTYTTLGYLTAIISILGFCIMPRAKFIQTMTMNIIAICLGAAVCILMLWSAGSVIPGACRQVLFYQDRTLRTYTSHYIPKTLADFCVLTSCTPTSVQVRIHTEDPARPSPYNSSQSAVISIWLFTQIWFINTIKAKFPQLAFPAIMCSIFVNVAGTYGPQFTTSAACLSFIRRLLYTFLTGFAISSGVSLFIFPLTSRKVVTKEITGYVMLLKGALQAHQNYFQSLETSDIFEQGAAPKADGKPTSKASAKKPEIEALKKITTSITALHAKLYGDLPFAKREVAWGKLTPKDFEGVFKCLRAIMIPLSGLGSLIDLFDRYAELNHWNKYEAQSSDSDIENGGSEEKRQQAIKDWNEIMTSVHEPFATLIQAMDGGLQHVLLKLELVKTPKAKASAKDAEAKGDMVQPGDGEYACFLEKQCDTFSHGKELTLQHWVETKGIKVRKEFFQSPDPLEGSNPDEVDEGSDPIRHRTRRQLYLVLYIVFLLHSISKAVLDLVRLADEIDLTNRKSKLINPGKKRFEKWLASIFKAQDHNRDNETTVMGTERNSIIYMGEAYNMRKEPEHLPPANAWEKFGNHVRGIARFLRSPDSAFGFRTACATMSIAIIAYLRDTQRWFVKQRIVWAMIMVAISMVPTSGATVFQFILRIGGTIIAMVFALICWYIVDQKTAGVIVMLWFLTSFGFYFPLKRPELVIAALISVVTTTLIIGYELEVRKIGRAVATSNGPPYYPIYLLAPYRLACVVGGLGVAFFWTIFPYPISEHSVLRQKLGGALYLSANYYSIMHETVLARIRGDEGDPNDPRSPASQLTKARNKVFAKQMLTLQGLKMHSEMVKWEFPLGGKFPRKEYEAIIQYVTNITNYTALIGYASTTFAQAHQSEDESTAQWFRDFQRIFSSVNITSHEITSLLAMLSSSITTGQPLPPYLTIPESYELSSKMEEVDKDILGIRHIAEPGYAAFAVMQISTRCIHMDIQKLLGAIKRLVGELDFSFHTISTADSSETDTLAKTDSRRCKQD